MEILKRLRGPLRPIRRVFSKVRTRSIEWAHSFRKGPPGSAEWLVNAEVTYGGLVTGVARNKVSPLDPRSHLELASGGMTGGDRMLHHGYARVYELFLKRFLNEKKLCVAEFGVLKGTGLAIWCDLFADARVLGLDIDLDHFESNRRELLRRGAFRRNSPEIFEYDQLADGCQTLADILRGDSVDIAIDDGLHSVDSIVMTWRSIRSHLAPRFVYFIEDFPGLLDRCGEEFSGFDTMSFGMMTVISARVAEAGGRYSTR